MQVGIGETSFEWIENWAKIPASESGRKNGRTHAVAVNRSGQIIVFHQADPAVLIYDEAANLVASWGDRFAGAHGMALVQEGDQEYLWLTDHLSGEVAKMTVDGQTVMTVNKPELPVYENGKYAPTWVTVNQERFGGNGDVWVADGYGLNYVHRYDKHGNYKGSINGEEGDAGVFRCPHSMFVDVRGGEPELYIADRANGRIQVYDLDGHYKRVIGEGSVNRPCDFAALGDWLVVPEYRDNPRVTILDRSGQAVAHLGEHEGAQDVSGWPNNRDIVKPGLFNSPHGVAVDDHGSIFIVEWIVGGRIIKLAHTR